MLKCLFQNQIVVVFAVIAFAGSKAFAGERPTFYCSKKNMSICYLEVVLPLEKLELFKSEKIDLSLYRQDNIVYRVDRYRLTTLDINRERGTFVSRVKMRGEWRVRPQERQRIMRDTILARSESIDF